MRVELVQIAALLPANIALPRVTLAVTTFVKEVQRLIRKRDSTVSTLEPTCARIRPRRSGRLASRVWIRIRATVVATAVVICGTGRKFAAQVVPQQRLQRRHLDQRRQRKIAGRRTRIVHTVAIRFLLDGDQGDRRCDGFVSPTHIPEENTDSRVICATYLERD